MDKITVFTVIVNSQFSYCPTHLWWQLCSSCDVYKSRWCVILLSAVSWQTYIYVCSLQL